MHPLCRLVGRSRHDCGGEEGIRDKLVCTL